MEIFLITLPATFLVLLYFFGSATSSSPGSSVPDLNYGPRLEYKRLYNPDNTFWGYEYGDGYIKQLYNPDGTMWGYKYKGKRIQKVYFSNNAELFTSDHVKIGIKDGQVFYDQPAGTPGRREVPILNGYYAVENGVRVATFEDVWRYEEDRTIFSSPPRHDHHNRPTVRLNSGCGLYTPNRKLIGIFDGTEFYDRTEGLPGRKLVHPKNGYYASYEGRKKDAIFEDGWRPAPEEEAGPSGEGTSRAVPRRSK